jgi:hypothetical protein
MPRHPTFTLCAGFAILLMVFGCALPPSGALPKKSECLNLSKGREFIVAYPENALPVEKTAARELASHIEKMIGAKSVVLPEQRLTPGRSADAYVGRCEDVKAQKLGLNLPREGYDIRLVDGKLFIVGDDESGSPFVGNKRTGTLFGVYDFLERDMGITWIWPGETGEDVPKSSSLLVPPFERRAAPKLIFRCLKFSAAYPEPKSFKLKLARWFKRMRLSNTTKTWYGHSWGRYVDKKTRKEHPEWFALWNGKRQGPHYCTSNKEFRDFIARRCLEDPKNKGCSIVSISPNDGYGFCECAKCRALDPPGTDYSKSVPNLSNRHWAYANYVARKVAETKPDLGVGMIAYTAYQQPPSDIAKFADNLYTQLCYSQAYFIKPDKKRKFLSNLEKWGRKGLKFTMYEYWGMHYWLDLPYIFTSQLKESMPILHKAGLSGMKSEAAKNFATQGPNYYLGAHLMWDPEMDGEVVLKRFYAAFGPAAKHVRRYYETFENSLLENQKKLRSFGYLELINTWPELFPEKTLTEAGECLEKACGAVAGDPVLEKRLEIVEIGWKYTKLMVELLGIYRRLGRSGVPLWAFGRAGIESEFDFWKKKTGMSAMPKSWVDFCERHPDVPLEKTERLALLKRALELGNERERILEKYVELPTMSMGMYKYMKGRGYYQWHKVVKEEIRKMESE